MRLFIQIRDGQPYEHPIMDWNFADAFPDIDMDNLPPEFAEFVRIPEPNIEVGIYEVAIVTHYAWDGSIVKDVWGTRPMTDEERAEKDQLLAIIAATELAMARLQANGTAPDVIS